ncbi:MAG: acetylornithine transaminase [Jatrophihabitantaceae bacterium]
MTVSARWDKVMMANYGTPPITLDHGDGVRVWDVDGNSYLDFVGGIAVSSLGHAHPAVIAAVTAQVGRLAHTSNLAIHEPGVRLAERLVALVGLPSRVFFANSGTEANECAIKLVRKAGNAQDRHEIVAFNHSFHGRTLGALSLTGTPAKRTPFEPLPGPVTFVDYGDLDALRAAVGPHTAAVFVEPMLGEGGVVPPPAGYLAAVRQICTDSGALMAVDEIQSGVGRTGHWFASLAEGVRPDILTLAKGLGGGLPIGACIGIGAAGEIFAPGDHGSTFGGNPVSCAAALAVLDTIANEHLLDDVKRVGEHLANGLDALTGPLAAGSRGSGLWRALALAADQSGAVEAAARRRGLLVNAVKPAALRFAPPLITTEADVDQALPLLQAALDEVSNP